MAWLEHRGRAMGSELHLVVDGTPELVDVVVSRIAALERCWTRFAPDSELSRLNAAAGAPRHASDDLLALLRHMRLASALTDGLYDPFVLPALTAQGYDHSHETGTPADAPAGSAFRPGLRVELTEPDLVRLPPEGAIDPGGIGKGLAADLAVELLLQHGAAGAMVNIGGDLCVGGSGPDTGWTVAVEAARDPSRPVLQLSVTDAGVATSTTERRWTWRGRQVNHVIDPRNGTCAVTDLDAVTVIAVHAWEAEALATSALLLGAAGGYTHLCEHQVEAVLQTTGGAVLVTPGLVPLAAVA